VIQKKTFHNIIRYCQHLIGFSIEKACTTPLQAILGHTTEKQYTSEQILVVW